MYLYFKNQDREIMINRKLLDILEFTIVNICYLRETGSSKILVYKLGRSRILNMCT